MTPSRPALSVVATLYNSAPYLTDFHRRVTAVAHRAGDYEIILVNDGSPDDSLAQARRLVEADARVRLVDLSRNFGHHKAMMTGLRYATGQRVFLIDSDLEEEPELLESFAARMDETAVDVVYGVQERRRGRLGERITGAAYYALFNALSSYPVPKNLLTVRLMTRRYVDALLEHREREINIGGLWAITGFAQLPVAVNKAHKGTSTYDMARKLAIVVDSITSYSNRPLIYIFYLGVMISILAGIAGLDLLVRRIFFGVLLEGWPSLIISIWFLGGLTMLCLGVIGIYLAKIFTETKQRPLAVVREVFEYASTASRASLPPSERAPSRLPTMESERT